MWVVACHSRCRGRRHEYLVTTEHRTQSTGHRTQNNNRGERTPLRSGGCAPNRTHKSCTMGASVMRGCQLSLTRPSRATIGCGSSICMPVPTPDSGRETRRGGGGATTRASEVVIHGTRRNAHHTHKQSHLQAVSHTPQVLLVGTRTESRPLKACGTCAPCERSARCLPSSPHAIHGRREQLWTRAWHVCGSISLRRAAAASR